MADVPDDWSREDVLQHSATDITYHDVGNFEDSCNVFYKYNSGWVSIADKGDDWDDYRASPPQTFSQEIWGQEMDDLEAALDGAAESQLERTCSYDNIKPNMKSKQVDKLKETLAIADSKIEELIAKNRALLAKNKSLSQSWTQYVHRDEMRRQIEEAVKREKAKQVGSPSAGGSADPVHVDKSMKRSLFSKWSDNSSVPMNSNDFKWWMLCDFGVNDASPPPTPEPEDNDSQVVPVMNTGGLAPRNLNDEDEDFDENEFHDTSDPSNVILLYPKAGDTDAIKKDLAEQNYNLAIQFEDKAHGGIRDGRQMSVPRRIKTLEDDEKHSSDAYKARAEKFSNVIKNLTENITKFKALVEVNHIYNFVPNPNPN